MGLGWTRENWKNVGVRGNDAQFGLKPGSGLPDMHRERSDARTAAKAYKANQNEDNLAAMRIAFIRVVRRYGSLTMRVSEGKKRKAVDAVEPISAKKKSFGVDGSILTAMLHIKRQVDKVIEQLEAEE